MINILESKMTKRNIRTLQTLFMLLFFLMSVSAWAVPAELNYQGVLKDDSGTPVHDITNMNFKLYDEFNTV